MVKNKAVWRTLRESDKLPHEKLCPLVRQYQELRQNSVWYYISYSDIHESPTEEFTIEIFRVTETGEIRESILFCKSEENNIILSEKAKLALVDSAKAAAQKMFNKSFDYVYGEHE